MQFTKEMEELHAAELKKKIVDDGKNRFVNTPENKLTNKQKKPQQQLNIKSLEKHLQWLCKVAVGMNCIDACIVISC